jgi:Amt family ammonium transporter
MPSSPALLSDTSTALCLLCIFLVPLAAAGLALVNTGFGRGRSAAHSMLSAMCVFSVAVLVYLTIGFSLQSYAGGPDLHIILAGRSWSLLGAAHFMMRGHVLDTPSLALLACLQLFSVGLASLIPLGAGSDRWRLGASCASTALFAGIVYPLFAHWLWGGGWLAQLSQLPACGSGAIDAGGAGVIQAVGGISALVIVWILGPRHGKYEASGMAIPAHNMPFVLFGCMLSLVGWMGLDSAAALLLAGAGIGTLPVVAINNIVSAGAALLTALLLTRFRYTKPDASITANGFVAGLVAVSGCSPWISPPLAAVIGIIAGLIIPFSVEWLDRLGFDDPTGSISVHAVGGLWGIFAAGLFVHSRPGQWLAQLLTISALLGIVLPLTYGLNLLLDRFYQQRVSREGERHGLDLHELGAGAYPELSASNKEFR